MNDFLHFMNRSFLFLDGLQYLSKQQHIVENDSDSLTNLVVAVSVSIRLEFKRILVIFDCFVIFPLIHNISVLDLDTV